MRILDLATQLIRLSGLQPERDIKIVYSGIRPGEKISEELFLDGEHHRRTCCPKVFIATSESAVESAVLERLVIELVDLVEETHSPDSDERMRAFLPEVCCYIDNHLPKLQQLGPESYLPKPAVRPLASSRIEVSAAATATS